LVEEVGIMPLPTCCFSFRATFVEEVLPAMVKTTMQLHLSTLSTSFDLWMSRGGMDTFALVINYLNESWMPQHFTIGLFEVHETIGLSMANQLCSLLEKYDLMHRMIAFVKDEGSNLMSMAIALHSIFYCRPLKLQWDYEGTCFGHIMSKACHYATNNEKVTIGQKHVSVKATQRNLQNIITWIKKSRKGR